VRFSSAIAASMIFALNLAILDYGAIVRKKLINPVPGCTLIRALGAVDDNQLQGIKTHQPGTKTWVFIGIIDVLRARKIP
jgi:hypothetical protein